MNWYRFIYHNIARDVHDGCCGADEPFVLRMSEDHNLKMH